MDFKSIEIKGIGGIKSLDLSFDRQMNIICGPNGVGKTTILECIAHSFSANKTLILKRHPDFIKGSIVSIVKHNSSTKTVNFDIVDFEPEEKHSFVGLHDFSSYLLSLKMNRYFSHQPLNSISRDAIKNVQQIYEEAKHGVNINEAKGWFVNRYLYSAHHDALEKEQIFNLVVRS